MTALSASNLSALAQPIYGLRWQSALAREMDVAVRTVQRWARDGIDRPATADAVRRFLEERARAIIPAPPEGVDRDNAAYDMVRPRIDALVRTAEAAGWHPAEVLTGAICATADLMREGAGAAAAIETVKSVLESLKSQRDT